VVFLSRFLELELSYNFEIIGYFSNRHFERKFSNISWLNNIWLDTKKIVLAKTLITTITFWGRIS